MSSPIKLSISSKQPIGDSWIPFQLLNGIIDDQLTPITTNKELKKYNVKVMLNKQTKCIKASAIWIFKCETSLCSKKWDAFILAPNIKRNGRDTHNLQGNQELKFRIFGHLNTNYNKTEYINACIYLEPKYNSNGKYIGAEYIESKENNNNTDDSDNDSSDDSQETSRDGIESNNPNHESDSVDSDSEPEDEDIHIDINVGAQDANYNDREAQRNESDDKAMI